jgi:hypothetical protein
MQTYVLYISTYFPAGRNATAFTITTQQRETWEASGVQSDNYSHRQA